MQRLSGPESFMLTGEGPTWHMHTAALVVIDPRDSPGFSAEKVRNLLAERLPLVPKFLCKLKEVPFGLDRPLWAEDEDFDLDFHFRRIGVPSPGGPRELGDLIGSLFSYPIDRRHPLWELWFLEGLEGGRMGMLMKTHHAMIDGVSGAGLAEVLADLEPDPPPKEIPATRVRPHVPSDVELIARSAVGAVTTPIRMGRFAWQIAQQGVTLAQFSRRKDAPPNPITPAVPTPFNGSLSPSRRFAYSSVPLSSVKALAKRHEVKVNDVVLAVVASALRRYLLKLEMLPEGPLRAAVPVSARKGADDMELGVKVTAIVANLATDIEDPLERLMTIHRGMTTSKEMHEALQAKKIMNLSDVTAPGLANLAWRLVAQNVESRAFANLVISNVPGAPIPIYSAGAKIESMIPLSTLQLGMGMNCTVMSYLDRMDFGFVVDRELVADPWMLVEGIPLALEELEQA